MLVPYQWLKEYVEVNLSPAELGEALTLVGLEVEAIHDVEGAPVLDVKVTPNRGDCLSISGVAREAAAALDLPLKQPEIRIAEAGPAVETLARVEILEPDLCPRYSARVITGTRVGESPPWAAKRLLQCGMRPINAIVDATNLAMLELGQPLHAFDYDLIKRGADGLPHIIVRLAEANEYLMTLDGAERRLAASMLVIADPERAIALAGVMGGANSEVNNETTRVLLESAHFDPVSVRRTAKALGLPSEAAYRFERVVDPGGTVRALDRVAEIIVAFSGGEIARGAIDANPKPILPVTIALRPARANALLGTDLPAAEMARLLRRLQLEVKEGEPPAVSEACPEPAEWVEPLVVTAPTFRPDLQKEIDLVEEVARIYGYDRIPTTLARMPTMRGRQAPQLEIEERARRVLQACGLCEAMTYSLEDARVHDRLDLSPDDPLRCVISIKNPKSDDFTQLRTTMLSSLLHILATNARRGVGDVHEFEIARVYLPRGANEQPHERRTVGVAIMGSNWSSVWNLDRQAARSDFFSLKAVAQALASEFAPGRALEFEPLEHPTFQPGRAARVRLEGRLLGMLGEVAEAVAAHHDLGEPAHVMELNLEALAGQALTAAGGARQARPISRFPAVRRDLAIVVADDVPAERVASLIRDAGGDLLEELALFDVYRGKQVEAGHKSLAYALAFRRMDRTLTDEEADAALAAIVERLRAELGARLRT